MQAVNCSGCSIFSVLWLRHALQCSVGSIKILLAPICHEKLLFKSLLFCFFSQILNHCICSSFLLCMKWSLIPSSFEHFKSSKSAVSIFSLAFVSFSMFTLQCFTLQHTNSSKRVASFLRHTVVIFPTWCILWMRHGVVGILLQSCQ